MSQDQPELPPEQIRDIPKWTRAYSSNRTLPTLVILAVSLVLFVAGCLLFARAGNAYRAGLRTEFAVCLAAGLTCLAVLMSPAIPSVNRKVRAALSRRLYSEGVVAPDCSTIQRRRRWAPFVAFAFGSCVLVSVYFGSRIPAGYEQPVSALYVVPFLIFLAPENGIAGLLWPLLYGLHALLILTGVPITFHGKWSDLENLLLAIFGYGILSLLVGHLYSRGALRRLRRLA
jgi:hypothetical protein